MSDLSDPDFVAKIHAAICRAMAEKLDREILSYRTECPMCDIIGCEHDLTQYAMTAAEFDRAMGKVPRGN